LKTAVSPIHQQHPIVHNHLPTSPCATCRQHSRAYLAHLFRAKELLYYRLATIHNLQHYLDLAREARLAIQGGGLARFVSERLALLSC
jgi:queuine tRNA-ribosyltransferase